MPDPENYRARIRQFVMQFFSDEELTNLCFDYFPFVHNKFSIGMQKGQKARLLIAGCENRGKMPDLLAALKRERPQPYDEFFAQEMEEPSPEPKPIKRNPRQIFISHAHQDAELAQRLAVDLRDHGWEIWLAQDNIRPGEKWVEAINRGLAESGVFVLVLTETAVNSRWVQSETNAAIGMEHRGELRFLPLEFEHVSVPPLWEGYQRISFREDYKAGLEKMLAILQPDTMAQLRSLYQQMQQAFGREDWDQVQVLGNQILEVYPDYRATAQMLAMATQEARRRALPPEEAASPEQRPSRQRRIWPLPLASLKRLPAWGWVLLLVLLVAVGLLLWVVRDDNGSGGEQPELTITALSISLAQTVEADEVGVFGETSTAMVTTALTRPATTTPTVTPSHTSTISVTPSRTPTASATPSHTPAPTIAPTATAVSAPPPSSGQPQGLPVDVYVDWFNFGQANAYTDVFLVYANGDVSNLTDDTNRENNAVLSPDRTKVAFERGAPAQIYVINVDGTGLRQLTSGPQSNTDPAWSADGTEITFRSWQDDRRYAIRPDGTGLRPVD